MFSFIGKILCWFGYHKMGEPYEFPHEDNEEIHPYPGRMVLLAHCIRCGDGPYRIT